MNPVRSEMDDRIESVKAGVVGAAASIPALAIVQTINTTLRLSPTVSVQTGDWQMILLENWQATVVGMAPIAIALLSGALFGLTYRYAVRQDFNSHLRSGVVLAFGLVRGLAQVEVWLREGLRWQIGIPVAENLLWFAFAAVALEFCLTQGWVKRSP